MKLYVANCSKQDCSFTYMLPENTRPFMHNIRMGSQVGIDCQSEHEAQHIVKQHEVYGMRHVKDIKKGFGGLAYQFDKVISIEAIEQGISQKEQQAIEAALEAQKITAVASDKLIADKAQEAGVTQRSALEIEVVEEKKNPADNGDKINQTISVVRDNLQPSRNKKRGR